MRGEFLLVDDGGGLRVGVLARGEGEGDRSDGVLEEAFGLGVDGLLGVLIDSLVEALTSIMPGAEAESANEDEDDDDEEDEDELVEQAE